MKNFIQPGDVVTLTAPTDVISGQGVLVGSLFGVAAYAAKTGEPVEVKLTGVYTLPKVAGAIEEGQAVYWDGSAVTLADSGMTLIGAAVKAALSGDAVAYVRLNGVSVP